MRRSERFASNGNGCCAPSCWADWGSIWPPRVRRVRSCSSDGELPNSGSPELSQSPGRFSPERGLVTASAGRSPLCSFRTAARSEEHTSELQSRGHLVCRLLLDKKKNHYRLRGIGDHAS